MRSTFDFNSSYQASRHRYVDKDVEAMQYVNAVTALIQNANDTSQNTQEVDKGTTHHHHHVHQFSDLASSRLPFPLKLYQMLEDVECQGKSDIISWLPQGNGFLIHKPHDLTDKVLPDYFRQTKYTSFTRQLHMYGFERATGGFFSNAFIHPKFIRGQKMECLSMSRTKSGQCAPKKCSNERPSGKPECIQPSSTRIPPSPLPSTIPTDISFPTSKTEYELTSDWQQLLAEELPASNVTAPRKYSSIASLLPSTHSGMNLRLIFDTTLMNGGLDLEPRHNVGDEGGQNLLFKPIGDVFEF